MTEEKCVKDAVERLQGLNLNAYASLLDNIYKELEYCREFKLNNLKLAIEKIFDSWAEWEGEAQMQAQFEEDYTAYRDVMIRNITLCLKDYKL